MYAQRSDLETELREKIGKALQNYQQRSGVQIPSITFHWIGAEKKSWTLSIFEVPVARGEVNFKNTADSLAKDVYGSLIENGYLFMGIQETSSLLTRFSDEYPDIAKEALRCVPLQNMALIFRNLVHEDVPLRNLRAILEGLINASQTEKDVNNLTEYARNALSRELCHRYSTDGKLRAVSLSPKLEEYLTQGLSRSAGTDNLALDPDKLKRIKTRLINVLGSCSPDVLITSVHIRKYCRELLALSGVNTVVLSYSEIVPTLNLDIVETVEFSKL